MTHEPTTSRACPCGHVLYPWEGVLCDECVQRIEEEVAAEIFLEELGVQEEIEDE